VNIIVNIPINNLKGNNYGKAVIGNYTMPIAAVAIPITPDNTDMPYCPPYYYGLGSAYQFGRRGVAVFEQGVPSVREIEFSVYIFGIRIRGFNRIRFDIEPIQINFGPNDTEMPKWVLEKYDAVILVEDGDIEYWCETSELKEVYEKIKEFLKTTEQIINGDLVQFVIYGYACRHPAVILETGKMRFDEVKQEDIENRVKERLERMLNDAEAP
jgi:hypothetical protein